MISDMEVVGRTLRERMELALVVFAVFLTFDYVQNDVEWINLLLVVLVFSVVQIGLDAIWRPSEK